MPWRSARSGRGSERTSTFVPDGCGRLRRLLSRLPHRTSRERVDRTLTRARFRVSGGLGYPAWPTIRRTLRRAAEYIPRALTVIQRGTLQPLPCRRRDSNPDTRIMIPRRFGVATGHFGPRWTRRWTQARRRCKRRLATDLRARLSSLDFAVGALFRSPPSGWSRSLSAWPSRCVDLTEPRRRSGSGTKAVSGSERTRASSEPVTPIQA
jgi:hypothetical protein